MRFLVSIFFRVCSAAASLELFNIDIIYTLTDKCIYISVYYGCVYVHVQSQLEDMQRDKKERIFRTENDWVLQIAIVA